MSDSDNLFARDVRRAVVLGTYIAHWGMPETRRVISKDAVRIEVYCFPASEQTGGINRLATVGALDSAQEGEEAELLFGWLPEPGEPIEPVEDLVFDVAVHCRQTAAFRQGAIVSPRRTPQAMGPSSILLDEPLTEDASLTQMCIGNTHLRVFWLVPLFEDEVRLAQKDGFEALDELRQSSAQSAFNLRRRSMLT